MAETITTHSVTASAFGGGWNHRVFRESSGEPDDPHWFTVREVYYDADGNPSAYTSEAVSPGGYSTEELLAELEMFKRATEKPVLTEADFPPFEPAATNKEP